MQSALGRLITTNGVFTTMTTQSTTQQSIKNAFPPASGLSESSPMDLSDIQDWLAEQVAGQLCIEADDVDTRSPFHSYGLDSVQAMAIATQGKQRFGLEISPLVIWNCPTIDSLSAHIVEELAADDSDLFEI